MRHLENTGLFILSGFFFLFFRKLDYFFVCAFLLCLCLCCTSYFAQSKRLHLVLCTAFIAAAFLIPGTVSVFSRSILCAPSGSVSYSGSFMQCSLLLRHLVRRRTNSSVFLLGNLLVSPGFPSAKPHRSRRMSGTTAHETKR